MESAGPWQAEGAKKALAVFRLSLKRKRRPWQSEPPRPGVGFLQDYFTLSSGLCQGFFPKKEKKRGAAPARKLLQ
jgi:hypothetical protein